MHTFSTSDFPIAAYALCKDAKLVRIDRSQRRAMFVFESELSESDITNGFYGNEDVPVEDFVTAQVQLKKRLFSNAF